MPAQSPDEPTSHADAGDGVELTPMEASQGSKGSGSRRVMWLLIASLALVFVALFGVFAFHAPGLSTAKTGSTKSTDVGSFASPQPSPRPAPPTPTEANGGESAAHPANVQ